MNSNNVEDTAFPKFDNGQMESVKAIGDLVSFETDEELIKQAKKDYSFYVIKSGDVRVVEKCDSGEILIATLGPRSFTGDVDMLTRRSAVTSTIANQPVEAYCLCGWRLRKLLGAQPEVSDMLLEAFQLRRQLLEVSDFVGIRLIGKPETRATTQIREFFYKNHVPYTFTIVSSKEGQKLLDCLDANELGLPIVHCNGQTFGNPSLTKVAECIGISQKIDQELFDLVIVGSGPAGLAASVYAASEGIKTLVIDSVGPGGQAASSSKIENFIGFPSGLTGSELANRGYLQALKLGHSSSRRPQYDRSIQPRMENTY